MPPGATGRFLRVRSSSVFRDHLIRNAKRFGQADLTRPAEVAPGDAPGTRGRGCACRALSSSVTSDSAAELTILDAKCCEPLGPESQLLAHSSEIRHVDFVRGKWLSQRQFSAARAGDPDRILLGECQVVPTVVPNQHQCADSRRNRRSYSVAMAAAEPSRRS